MSPLIECKVQDPVSEVMVQGPCTLLIVLTEQPHWLGEKVFPVFLLPSTQNASKNWPELLVVDGIKQIDTKICQANTQPHYGGHLLTGCMSCAVIMQKLAFGFGIKWLWWGKRTIK
ncbi:MAG: hypothetical protein HOO87_13615 [Methyloglobulus sp.]|nr:hypothetical protein [Methyloglobulus sp.]